MWTRMGLAPAGEVPSDADVTALCGEADADPSTSSARTFSRGISPGTVPALRSSLPPS